MFDSHYYAGRSHWGPANLAIGKIFHTAMSLAKGFPPLASVQMVTSNEKTIAMSSLSVAALTPSHAQLETARALIRDKVYDPFSSSTAGAVQ